MPPEGGNCRITPSGNAGRANKRCYGFVFVLRFVVRERNFRRYFSLFPY